MSDSIAQPWIKVHKAVNLLMLVVLLQGLVRHWFYDLTLIHAVPGDVILLLIIAVIAIELWSLQTRRSFWVSPALVPLIFIVGACSMVWVGGPSS
ncbi:hypothetical protein JZU69_06300, partial [bacterium]|nr:hypothetical protein [bacterium]